MTQLADVSISIVNFSIMCDVADQKLSYAGEKRNLKLPAPPDVGSGAVSGIMD
jgi:hypothetical protein